MRIEYLKEYMASITLNAVYVKAANVCNSHPTFRI